MSMKILCAAFVFISFLVSSIESLSCPPYEACKSKKYCQPTESLNCKYGITSDLCGCCDACLKGPQEECGGLWGIYGDCAESLICTNPPPVRIDNQGPGKCAYSRKKRSFNRRFGSRNLIKPKEHKHISAMGIPDDVLEKIKIFCRRNRNIRGQFCNDLKM